METASTRLETRASSKDLLHEKRAYALRLTHPHRGKRGRCNARERGARQGTNYSLQTAHAALSPSRHRDSHPHSAQHCSRRLRATGLDNGFGCFRQGATAPSTPRASLTNRPLEERRRTTFLKGLRQDVLFCVSRETTSEELNNQSDRNLLNIRCCHAFSCYTAHLLKQAHRSSAAAFLLKKRRAYNGMCRAAHFFLHLFSIFRAFVIGSPQSRYPSRIGQSSRRMIIQEWKIERYKIRAQTTKPFVKM